MPIRFRVRGVTKASRVGILCSAVGENLGLSLTRENPPRLKSYEICNIHLRIRWSPGSSRWSVENLDFEERASTGVDRDRCRVLGLLNVVEICRDSARFSQSRQDFFSNFFVKKIL